MGSRIVNKNAHLKMRTAAFWLALGLSFWWESSISFSQSPATEAGKKLFAERGCPVCHAIKGEGGTVGPSLTQVGNRRDRDWLIRWLKDPQTIKPGTIMPAPPVTDEEREQLAAFLLTNKKEISRVSSRKSPREAGRFLFSEYDCFACHKIRGKGGTVGPELTQTGKRRDLKWISAWLENPPAIKPGTFMPRFSFSEEEIKSLAAYLASLK